MLFSVGTNFDNGLINTLKKDEVRTLYGKLPVDFIGGGRPSYVLPKITRKKVAAHIQEIHKQGLKFDYLLNSSCLGNKEFTSSGQKKIHELLMWLSDIKIDQITLTLPYLAEIIKEYYPHFKINVSSFADVDSIERVHFWENLGAHLITLSPHKLTRDFELLKAIRKNTKVKLQLIANLGCSYNCALSLYHRNLNSHASQPQNISGKPVVDYCILKCGYMKINNPENFIKASWIRPEDTHYYEDIGIDYLKLVDRSMPTHRILKIISAYTKRKYNGNLLDICGRRIFKGSLHGNNFLFKFNDGIYIDNQALEGFLKHFLKINCRLKSCEECGYCGKITSQVVKIKSRYLNNMLKHYKEVLKNRNMGKFLSKG